MSEVSTVESILGPGAYLFVCKVGAVVVWMAQLATPRGLWDRYLVPGRLVVVTTSIDARDVIEKSLDKQRHRLFFRVLKVTDHAHIGVAEDERALRPSKREGVRPDRLYPAPLAGAWDVLVKKGTERAVLLELELNVASGLEVTGAYVGIDNRLSRLLARRVMTAHQARRVRVCADSSLRMSAPVELDKVTHPAYLDLLGITDAPSPKSGLSIAVLDTAINDDHLVEGVAGRITRGPMSTRVKGLKAWHHGALTASIVGTVSPHSPLEVFTVVDREEVLPEIVVLSALQATHARIICMCVEFDFPPRFKEDSDTVIETTLREMGDERVIVTASGNTWDGAGPTSQVGFPARCPTVLTIGAVNKDCRRAPYSRYVFPKRPEPVYAMAPGGVGDEVAIRCGGQPERGTSIAAAYAAGVVARSLYAMETAAGGTIKTQQFFEALERDARHDFEPYESEPVQYGIGVLQFLGTASAEETTGRGADLREQVESRVSQLLSAGDETPVRVLAKALGLVVC